MHCCSPDLFWDGCNETQIFGPQIVDYPLRSHFTEQSTIRGLFPGVPSLNRLHSEIDQIHLSIEAQFGTPYLPLGDCHKNLNGKN